MAGILIRPQRSRVRWVIPVALLLAVGLGCGRRKEGKVTAPSAPELAERGRRVGPDVLKASEDGLRTGSEHSVVVHERFETENDMDEHTARGEEDAISDIPIGGTRGAAAAGVVVATGELDRIVHDKSPASGGTVVRGHFGVGGGAAGSFGFRSGGGRKRAIARLGGVAAPGPASAPTRPPVSLAFSGTKEVPGVAIASAEGGDEIAEGMDHDGGKKAPAPPRPAGLLKGGSRDDNDEFEEYLRFRKEYRENYAGQLRTGGVVDVDITERHLIEVRDAEGRPVPNAWVRLTAAGREVLRARTYADGKTFFFPRALGLDADELEVSAEMNVHRAARTFARNEQADWVIELPGRRPKVEPTLDLLFCLDTTGSMSDEIRAVQLTLREIVRRIDELPGDARVRLGLVEYRDRKDEYVTRVHGFTEDTEAFQALLDAVRANGGGDGPESVNEALHRSLDDVSWTEGPEGVRLVVLVADAPPHMDYGDASYAEAMKKAHSRGIKIYPLAASGLDRRGEYIFRQLAQYTSAKFLFITYGGRTSHDVKPFRENDLGEIVVGIVRDELAAFCAGTDGAAAEDEAAEETDAF